MTTPDPGLPSSPPGLSNPMAWGGAPEAPDPGINAINILLNDSAIGTDDYGMSWIEQDFPGPADAAVAVDSIVVYITPSAVIPWTIIAAQDSGSTGQIVLAAADATTYAVTAGQQFQMYSGVPTAGGVPATARVNANCSFETATSPWNSQNGATIATSTTDPWALDGGTHSCAMTVNGTSSNPQMYSELITLVPGAQYTATAGVTPSAAWVGGADLFINWYNSGTYISGTGMIIASLPASQTVVQIPPATPPSTANQLRLFAQISGTPPNTTTFYWDLVYASLYSTLLNSAQVYTITGTSTAGGYTTVSFSPSAPAAPVFGTWIEQIVTPGGYLT